MNDIHIGSKVKVVSGDHQGRSGTVTYIAAPRISYTEPELYALVEISVVDASDRVVSDDIAVPMRRLQSL